LLPGKQVFDFSRLPIQHRPQLHCETSPSSAVLPALIELAAAWICFALAQFCRDRAAFAAAGARRFARALQADFLAASLHCWNLAAAPVMLPP
jgi:hypothetical protein